MIRVLPAAMAERGRDSDVLHGERIADPYRWLEDGSDPRTKDWTVAQNARTRALLDALPRRAALHARLQDFLAVGVLGTPRPVGPLTFYERRAGEQRQSVLYVRTAPGTARPLIDPNALDARGLTSVDWWYPSADGRFVAYGLSRGGTELSTLQVVETATGRDLGERIPHTQRARVAWVEGGFYYTVHPDAGSVAPGDEHYYRRVRFHRLGDDHARDPLVFGDGRAKEDILSVDVDPGGRWVALSAFAGWARNDLYVLDREDPAARPRAIVEGADGLSLATLAGGTLWIRTNVGSPNYRIDAVDPAAPKQRRTVVPESEQPIEGFDVTRDHLIVHTLDRASSQLAVWSQAGALLRPVALPERCTVSGPQADPAGDRFGYTVESFARPPVAVVADARTGVLDEIGRIRTPAGFSADAIQVDQEKYRSRDGTPVTMFIVHRADVTPGNDPAVLLTGYGGFNISRTPVYSSAAAVWAEAGGVYVVANLRGGAEYGERWHRAGMLANKQNVFDDFAGAAEALIARGWAAPARLGILGGSNGGLLVGAAITQRPELFGAAVCAVPLLDMLRYDRFLIARFWIAEYGSADDPAAFRWLRAYSPYHNVRDGTACPPVLFTTAVGDSRVDPSHARKMTALLQWLQRSDPDAVSLIRVDDDAGHGVGKPLDKQAADLADQLAFLGWRLGLRIEGGVGTVTAGR